MARRGKLFGWTLGAVLTAAAVSGVSYYQYSVQQAANILAGNTSAPYTRFSTQQALNMMVSTIPAQRDSLVGMITFIYDDCVKAQYDSLTIFHPASGNWDFKPGLSIEPEAILYHGNPINFNTTQLRELVALGWDCGTVGWDEDGNLWNGNFGKVATGNFTSTNRFEDLFTRARAWATLDSLGIPYQPRWISWSNSSATAYQKAIASRLGYEFGFASAQSASGVGTRPNTNWPMYGWSGADTAQYGVFVSATPGWNSDRYEILQCLGEQNNSLQTKRAIWRAIQTKGLCVVILHSPVTWKTALTASAADTLGAYGNLGSMSGVMSFCNRYVRKGLLRVVTPSEAADWFYNRPISPGANWVFSNFRDIDRSVHVGPTTRYVPDQWLSFTSTSTWANKPMPEALLGNPTAGGYGGKNYVKMNWITASRNSWAGGCTRPWGQNNSDVWVIPPKGGGWTAHFEIHAIQDTTVASGSTANGDSLGVTYTAVKASYWNNWNINVSGGNQFLPMVYNDLGIVGAYTGWNSSANRSNTTAQFGNVFTFGYENNVNQPLVGAGPAVRHKEWLHSVTDWEYPADTDLLLISVWHGTNNASGEIRLSNPHLSFFKNSPPAGQ